MARSNPSQRSMPSFAAHSPLSDAEFLFYSRQLLLPDWSVDAQLQLKRSRVLLIGLGGLGCPAASYLAGLGVGELWLADGDRIELSNLPRQILFTPADIGLNKADVACRQLAARNPFIHCQSLPRFLAENELTGLLTKVDLVVDCTDRQDTKLLLNRLCHQQSIPWIGASATAYQGYSWTIQPGQGCLDCLGQDVPLPVGGCLTQGAYAPLLGQLALQISTMVLDTLLMNHSAESKSADDNRLDKTDFNERRQCKTTPGNQLQLYQHAKRQFVTCQLIPDAECRVCGSLQGVS